MDSTELGMFTFCSDSHPSKAKSSIVVTELGINIEVKRLIPLNAPFEIVITPYGIV